MPIKKQPKFKPGDKVWAIKAKGIVVVGDVVRMGGKYIRRRNKRSSIVVRYEYFVMFEEFYIDRRFGRKTPRLAQHIAESSLRPYISQEDIVCKVLGESFIYG